MTIKRQLEALHMLGVLHMREIEDTNITGKTIKRPYYSRADGIGPRASRHQKSYYRDTGTQGHK